MGHTIREPVLADADGLGAVHVSAWRAAYGGGLMPDDYLASLSVTERATWWRTMLTEHPKPRPRFARFVVETDGAVGGFIVVGPEAGDDQADRGELYAINVHADHWGSGIGSTLIDAGMAALADVGFGTVVLWVHAGNVRARRFYESRGWSVDGVEREEDVFDAIVPEVRYVLSLDPSTTG